MATTNSKAEEVLKFVLERCTTPDLKISICYDSEYHFNISWERNGVNFRTKFKQFKKVKPSDLKSLLSVDTKHKLAPYTSLKDLYKWIYKNTDATPSYICKCLNWANYNLYILPFKEYLDKLAYRRYGYNTCLSDSVIRNIEILKQNKLDGIENVSPICMLTNRSPQQLKKGLGPMWKVLAKNTFWRNQMLVRVIPSFFHTILGDYSNPFSQRDRRELDVELSKMILRKVPERYFKLSATLGAVRTNTRLKGAFHLWINKKDISEDYIQILRDYMMRDSLNPRWSSRRVQQEHDNRIRKDLGESLKGVSKSKYDWTKKISLPNLNLGDYKATLLTSDYEIKLEGVEMCHCVGSYVRRCKRFEDLIYSIKGPSFRSTLQITLEENSCRIQQHYMKYNQKVRNEAVNELAIKLAELVGEKTSTSEYKEIFEQKRLEDLHEDDF